jgi:hypothetical protein
MIFHFQQTRMAQTIGIVLFDVFELIGIQHYGNAMAVQKIFMIAIEMIAATRAYFIYHIVFILSVIV